MIREINVKEITKNIKEMCIEANYYPVPGYGQSHEKSSRRRKIRTWNENIESASGKLKDCRQMKKYRSVRIPEWQLSLWKWDRMFISRERQLEDAINEGVRQGYTEGYLRKSVVKDPLDT